jgi:cellulose synthase operon protein YhjQ
MQLCASPGIGSEGMCKSADKKTDLSLSTRVWSGHGIQKWISAMPDTKYTNKDRNDTQDVDATPRDVAGLYSWANLEESKYRDFSASRTQKRAESSDRHQLEQQKSTALAPDLASESDAVLVEQNSSPVGPQPQLGSKLDPRPSDVPRNAPRLGPHGLPARAKKKVQRITPQREPQRWAALRDVFGKLDPPQESFQSPPVNLEIPCLAFVSLAGGVGKTTLVASLGCALASQGESVLLVETNPYALLPFFFGATDLSGAASRVSASFTSAAPIHLMTSAIEPDEPQSSNEQQIAERIALQARGFNRLLIDVSTASVEITRQILRLSPVIIVVLTPDMASVVSLQPLQALFDHLAEDREQPFQLLYLLNQFDPSLSLHADVRSLLTHQLGARLLPIVMERRGAFSEALAEGRTVVDYAPEAQVTQDLNRLAQWLVTLDDRSSGVSETVRRRER